MDFFPKPTTCAHNSWPCHASHVQNVYAAYVTIPKLAFGVVLFVYNIAKKAGMRPTAEQVKLYALQYQLGIHNMAYALALLPLLELVIVLWYIRMLYRMNLGWRTALALAGKRTTIAAHEAAERTHMRALVTSGIIDLLGKYKRSQRAYQCHTNPMCAKVPAVCCILHMLVVIAFCAPGMFMLRIHQHRRDGGAAGSRHSVPHRPTLRVQGVDVLQRRRT